MKVTLNDPPPQVQFGMTIAGRWSSKSEAVVVLPLSAIFDKNGSTAVWRFDPHSGSVNLQPVNVARYESDTAVIAGGLDRGDVVVVAGINALREGQLFARQMGGPCDKARNSFVSWCKAYPTTPFSY